MSNRLTFEGAFAMFARYPQLSPATLEALQHYVYRLVDPQSGETFYVGKGTWNRALAHVNGEFQRHETDILSDKLDRIREIHRSGHLVRHVIHRHGLSSDKEAFEVEAALIEAYPNLTNGQGGRGSFDRGSMSIDQLNAHYAVEDIVLEHRALFINVRRSWSRFLATQSSLYDAVRYSWVLKPRNAHERLILAHRGGVIRGIFRAFEWMPSDSDEFRHLHAPRKSDASARKPKRYGFVGEEVQDAILSRHYLNKRVPPEVRLAYGRPLIFVPSVKPRSGLETRIAERAADLISLTTPSSLRPC